jgi:hypothetical protein
MVGSDRVRDYHGHWTADSGKSICYRGHWTVDSRKDIDTFGLWKVDSDRAAHYPGQKAIRRSRQDIYSPGL